MRNRINNFSSFMIAGQGLGLSLGVTSMLGTELGLITVMNFSQTGVLQYFSAFREAQPLVWSAQITQKTKPEGNRIQMHKKPEPLLEL